MAPDPSGVLLFARYAYGPNRLGYCGPDEHEELFQRVVAGGDGTALRRLARQFEGAYPYLELIAESNGMADPFDRRVVEAYWLGSSLLAGVGPRQLGRSLDERFRRRLGRSEWHWLAESAVTGGAPVHAFHVLNLIPRMGLLRSGAVDDVVGALDSCRIRWGRVLERSGDWLVADVAPLEVRDGRLTLGPPRPERVRAWRDGAGFLDRASVGDTVTLHWDWACDRLDRRQLAALRGWTSRQLAVANLAI